MAPHTVRAKEATPPSDSPGHARQRPGEAVALLVSPRQSMRPHDGQHAGICLFSEQFAGVLEAQVIDFSGRDDYQGSAWALLTDGRDRRACA